MASSLQSPGVQIIEKDASAVTVGASTTVGGTVGTFQWGPVMTPMLIDNEATLVSVFGKPDANTFSSFFAASNFLSYTNNLWVVRAETTNTNATSSGVGTLIKNLDNYESDFASGDNSVGAFAARYPGELGNGIKVSYADSSTFASWEYSGDFQSAPGTSDYAEARGGSNDELHIIVVDVNGKFTGTAGGVLEKYSFVSKASDALSYTGQTNYYKDVIQNQSSYIYWMDHPVAGWGVPATVAFPNSPVVYDNITDSVTLMSTTELADVTLTAATWVADVATVTFATNTVAPLVGSTVVVSGVTPTAYNGTFVVKSSTPTTVSYDLDVVTLTAGTVFGKIQTTSQVVATVTFPEMTFAPAVGSAVFISGATPSGYNGTHIVTASTTTSVTFNLTGSLVDGTVGNIGTYGSVLTGGTDDNVATNGELGLAWDLFKNTEAYDVSLFFVGNANVVTSKYVVDNVGEYRKDAVVFVSMVDSSGNIILSTSATKTTDAAAFKTSMGNSTYAVIDSGYKYMYDKYNDKYRWIALNSDIAGLCAKVDKNQDTWFSPAGLTKGQIKGAIKLSWNPNQSERDFLYKLSINPVVSFVGQGTLLYGDKTATSKPSAFDRINVRRLFLVLEKSIANSAKYQLFEQNDAVTRQQFIASIEPFLRDVQGRRGIDVFKIICDETNNTPQVIQTNEFRGTILVRAITSVNYIQLTFTAVGASVSFETAALV